VEREHRRIVVPAAEGSALLAAIVRDLDAAGVRLDELGLHRPTLDDAFLTLTGHTAEGAAADADAVTEQAVPPSRKGAA
jgi:ABC-2 type transport system ATP-binding protein